MMDRRLRLALSVIVIAALAGCESGNGSGSNVAGTDSAGPSGQGTGAPVRAATRPGPLEISREQLRAVDEMTALLEKIEDDATASAVLPDLRNNAARLRMLNGQMMAMQNGMTESERAAAAAQFNDPATQEQLKKMLDASSRMSGASLNAQLKAPGKRAEIQAACALANVPRRNQKS